MTTILYHDKEIMADTKALEFASGTNGGLGIFRKGKKIFKNDKIIVTFFNKFPCEKDEEETLRLSEWVARYVLSLEVQFKKLNNDIEAFGLYLKNYIFNTVINNNIESLIKLKQGKYKFGESIDEIILIFTKDKMISIGCRSEVIDKYKDEERIGKGMGVSLDAILDENGETVLTKNPVFIGVYDLDDIDFLYSGTGGAYITSSVKLGMTPKQGFKMALLLDNVSSCGLTNGNPIIHRTTDLKTLKPFSKKDLENIRKLDIKEVVK